MTGDISGGGGASAASPQAVFPFLQEVLERVDPFAILSLAAGLTVLFFAAWVLLALTRAYLLRLIAALVRRSPTVWDEILFDKALFHRLVWAVPIVVIHQGVRLVPHLPPGLELFLQRLSIAILVLILVRAFASLLQAVQEIYNRYPMARYRPIKGYLQVVSILAHTLGIIFAVAVLMNQSPWFFFSGLGAMTAILLLIFRDTLLSLVAGIQLTSNDLIRVGDWIEMPQFGADGDVVDIALNAVKVQNWDKTITVIPTHKFLEHSFRNWRGMSEAGGRRIKRSIHVDLSTIRFLGEGEIARFGRFVLLRDYMRQKVEELREYNEKHCTDPSCLANARRLTNIGTLRAYIVNYLRQHPQIHQQMTFLVRQLQPTAEGLPLEIYVFSKDTAWARYEGIQADIFDHILAIVPEFGLRVYQKPSGTDLAALASRPSLPDLPAPALRGGVFPEYAPDRFPAGPAL